MPKEGQVDRSAARGQVSREGPSDGAARPPASVAARLHMLQRGAGNRAVSGLVAQRLNVGFPVSTTGKPVPAKDQPSTTAKDTAKVGPSEPLQELAQTPDPVAKGTAWVQVKRFLDKKHPTVYLKAQNYKFDKAIPDGTLALAKKSAKLRSNPTKTVPGAPVPKAYEFWKKKPTTVLDEVAAGTPLWVRDVFPNGYLHVTVLEGPGATRNGWIDGGAAERAEGLAVAKRDNPLSKKKAVFDDVGANKEGSREKSAELLVESVEERAKKLVTAMESDLRPLTAFQRVSFILAGPTDGLELAYQKESGRTLRADLAIAFAGKPGQLSAQYLLSMLDNNGKPSPAMALALPLGKVDGTGSAGKALAWGAGAAVGALTTGAIGKKVKGALMKLAVDKRRVGELLAAMDPDDLKALLADPQAMEIIRSADKQGRFVTRMRTTVKVDKAKKKLEAAKTRGGAAQTAAEDQLAAARDEQLAAYVRIATNLALPVGYKQGQELVQWAAGKAGKAGPKTRHVRLGFDRKKFFDDVLAWRRQATERDIKEINEPGSKFQHEWAKVPGTLLGLTDVEKDTLKAFILSKEHLGKDVLIGAAKFALEAQSAAVGREAFKGRGLGTVIKDAIHEKRWATIEQSITDLDDEERKKLVASLDPDPKKARRKFDQLVFAAGLNKEERAGVFATVDAKYGEAGGTYTALKQLVEANTRSEIGTKAGYLKPTKLKKASSAFKGNAVGEQAVKMVADMEGADFIQVRQDKALLSNIQARSEPKTFARFLALLGMENIDDQVESTTDSGDEKSSRVMIDEARRAALHQPKHWALRMDKLIEQEITDSKNVSAGSDKAQLYVLVTKIQSTAREIGRLAVKKNKDADAEAEAQKFLWNVLFELAALDARKVDYLRRIEEERQEPLHAALAENKPISVEFWFRRAKKEGFGVGKLKRTDRMKVVWAFNEMDGHQLLKDWSNFHVFEGMKAEMDVWAAEASEADKETKEYLGLPGLFGETGSASEERALKRFRNAEAHMLRLKKTMNTFVLGIREERRADLRKHVRSRDERIQIEGLVSKRLMKAMKDDPEVKEDLELVKLPNDEFMKQKMRAVDALESQRHLDTTRQWSAFATAGSQLDEATRNVKGTISSTEAEQQKAQDQGLDADAIKKIRKKGAEGAEKALDERDLLEARFRDVQKTFRAIADVLFTLIVQGLVIGLTAGVAAPLSIGLQIGIVIGVEMMRAAFKAFVLGDDDYAKLGWDFALGVVAGTVRALTMNVSAGLEATLLHPAALGEHAAWLGPGITKGLSAAVTKAVMFAPEHVISKALQQKELSKVIKEGEDDIVDATLAAGKSMVIGFAKKVVMAGVKEGIAEGQAGAKGETREKPMPAKKTFGEAVNDRMQGGSTEVRVVDAQGNVLARGQHEVDAMTSSGPLPPGARVDNTTTDGRSQEQEQAWGRLEKQYKKETKAAMKKAAKTMSQHSAEKALDKDRHKASVKALRGEKEEKSPALKTVLEVIEKHPGARLDELVAKKVITPAMLAVLSPEEREKVEEETNAPVGAVDELVVSGMAGSPKPTTSSN